MLITFSGLDGAGKSTLIESVVRTLARANRPAAVLHMNHDLGVYAVIRSLARALRPRNAARGAPAAVRGAPRRGLGSAPGARGAARRLRHAIVWNKGLRTLLYPIDLMMFLAVRLYVERVRGHVLIMDRYFYDTLVDVFAERRRGVLKVLQSLTPTPSVAIYVDVTPEEAFARKGEYSVPYLQRRVSAYRTILESAPATVIIRNTDLGASSHEVEHLVLRRLAVS